MKYVKRLNLNRKRPASPEFNLVADHNNLSGIAQERIETNSPVSIQVPSGIQTDRPRTFKTASYVTVRLCKSLKPMLTVLGKF